MLTPEQAARRHIDAALVAAGWCVQDAAAANIAAARGVAVREFPLSRGHGFADYLLYVDGRAAGVIEAKPEGETLTGVEMQAEKYSAGVPPLVPAWTRPLPFLYQSTGVETRFTNRLDPEPRSRPLFHFHQPATLARWLETDDATPTELRRVAEAPGRYAAATTLRAQLRAMPPIHEAGLWPAQLTAVRNLERSFAQDRPRALVQMATGSGKTFTAITAIYRLIKFGGARRVLFLVDRANLGRQALKEFQQYTTPDDGRKFTELYNVQHLTANTLDPVARVCITTIQRLYSMLRGDPDLDPTLEEGSQFDAGGGLVREPAPVEYNPAFPVESFDVIVADECHRSIYGLWRQVLDYFDAYLVGLTATPSRQTFGFFNQNLVMEYNHEQAVADGVNVDFDVYRIRTRLTEQGATVEAGLWVDKRDRETRRKRLAYLDDDLSYGANELDRSVVALDQIRTVVRTYRDKLGEIFPGRTEVPKTLIFAKDDSHADDIVQIVREEFGKGNDFAQKITYRTGTARITKTKPGPNGDPVEYHVYKSSGVTPEVLLSDFRNSYNPRIVVTVDMIATGTDIKPLEVVLFMRSVKSRTFFEQMKGRGVRVVNSTDLQAVTPDARAKTRFVIVDAVGVCEGELSESRPLERQPSVAFDKLLQAVAFGNTDPEVLSSLAGRLARLDRQLGPAERQSLAEAGGPSLRELARGIVDALDPDRQLDAARAVAGLSPEAEPSAGQLAAAARTLLAAAAAPLAGNPALRERILQLKQRFEQTIDAVTPDVVLEAGYSEAAAERARGLVASWERFIADHKDAITALQVLYSKPYRARLRFADIKTLAAAINAPPRAWTPEALWRAYETLDRSRVRGSGGRMLTDIVSLVRFALHQEDVLVPHAEAVRERFDAWLAAQEGQGRRFTHEQRAWLVLIRDHVAASLGIAVDDFEETPFAQQGGAGRAYQLFGDQLDPLLDELNEVLAA